MRLDDGTDHLSRECPFIEQEEFREWKLLFLQIEEERNARKNNPSWPGCLSCYTPNDLCTGHTACRRCKDCEVCPIEDRMRTRCRGPCTWGDTVLRACYTVLLADEPELKDFLPTYSHAEVDRLASLYSRWGQGGCAKAKLDFARADDGLQAGAQRLFPFRERLSAYLPEGQHPGEVEAVIVLFIRSAG